VEFDFLGWEMAGKISLTLLLPSVLVATVLVLYSVRAHLLAPFKAMCCGRVRASVADPGCFIPDPDPTIAPSRIPDPGGKKAPDPDPQHWFARTVSGPSIIFKKLCKISLKNVHALITALKSVKRVPESTFMLKLFVMGGFIEVGLSRRYSYTGTQ
jgi:hypothetical protein